MNLRFKNFAKRIRGIRFPDYQESRVMVLLLLPGSIQYGYKRFLKQPSLRGLLGSKKELNVESQYKMMYLCFRQDYALFWKFLKGIGVYKIEHPKAIKTLIQYD